MKVDHIGYAVRDISKARIVFEDLGFIFDELIKDDQRNVSLCFGVKDGYTIELVSPLSNDLKSPIDAVLKKLGNTSYHICYISEDIEEDLKEMSAKKYKVIIPLEKAVAFDGRRVVFLYNPYIGLVELVESDMFE